MIRLHLFLTVNIFTFKNYEKTVSVTTMNIKAKFVLYLVAI